MKFQMRAAFAVVTSTLMFCTSQLAVAQAVPKVAVTDLAYQSEVAEYFEVSELKEKSSLQANSRSLSATSQSHETHVAGVDFRLSQGELRHFTADLKGAIIKGGGVGLVQGKIFDAGEPSPSKAEQVLQQVKTGKVAKPKRQPDINDIIARIRKGDFNGADYVLFGSVSHIDWRNEAAPIQGTSTTSVQFNLDISADFNLINTRTLEVKAAFTAIGSGNDTKLVSVRGDVVAPNPARIIRDTSKSLGEDAYAQLLEQFGISQPGMGKRLRKSRSDGGDASYAPADAGNPVMVFK